jgi:O-antigen/teichoic acid export membrane protein
MMGLAFLIVPRLGYSAELMAGVYVVTFAIIPVVLRVIQEAAFLAHERVELITYTTLVGSLVHVALSLLLLYQGHGIISVVTIYVVAQALMSACYFLLLNQRIARLQWDFRPRFAAQLLRQVWAFAGSSLLGALLARPEVMLLSLLQSDAQIGFYSAALQIVLLWQVIPETYMRNLYPVLSRSQQSFGRRDDQPILDQSIKYLLAISLPLAIGILVAAHPIVDLLYGPGFGPSVSLVRIMAVCVPLTFLFELLWRLLAARDQQNQMFRAQVAMSVIRLGGGYALIAWLASTGAAVSTALMILAHNLLLVWYARRDGTSLDFFRHAWRFVISALGMGTLAALLVANRADLWVVVVAAVTCYSVLVVMLRALSPAEISFIRKIAQVRSAP